VESMNDKPQGFRTLHSEAMEIIHSSFGSVGKLFNGEGIETVWVKKESEEIDPDWFSQPMLDLILVVKGKLKFEFERVDLLPCVVEPGDMIVLPPGPKCRAYRWPRELKGPRYSW